MTDHLRIAPGENWYRDVVLFFVSLFVVVAVVTSKDAVTQQREGRALAVSVFCGGLNSVIEAGRATITGGAAGVTGEFERNLRKLGYPPKKLREKQARTAARLYAKKISEGVAAATGGEGRVLVKKDGTLDCPALVAASAAR